jgi:ABC-2 type transport system permease protein
MIGPMATLVRWEWFKLARRWMPWILLIVLLLMSQLAVWGNYITYRSLEHSGGQIPVVGPGGRPTGLNCNDVLSGRTANVPPGTSPDALRGYQAECRQATGRLQQQLDDAYNAFSLPGSLPATLNLGTLVGLILLAILAASHVGTEYSWGTLRPVLARGTGRNQFVAAKIVILALVAAAALIAVLAATVLSSTIAASLATHPAQSAATVTWGAAAAAAFKSWVALVTYLIFAVCVTVLTRSSAAGIAIGIIYYIGEQILVLILSGLFGWFSDVAKYLLGQNLAAWARLSLFGPAQPLVGSLHAFLVLLVYAIGLTAITLAVFYRRDVTGASGG